MTYFAKINDKGIVENVIVAEQDFIDSTDNPEMFIETKKDGSIKKRYAQIGSKYDKDRDAFICKKQFDSWILNEKNCEYEPPISKPKNNKKKKEYYRWNEDKQKWKKQIISLISTE